MSRRADRCDLLNYIGDLSCELARMAADAECGHLAFLLELARAEAADLADTGTGPQLVETGPHKVQ